MIGEEIVLAHPLADISMGGCRFDAPAWESEGAEVQLVLGFPSISQSLPIEAKIVRASKKDMGVRFHKLSDQEKWALRKHLREMSKKKR